MEWKLADAKNRFSEVVNRALTEEPQRVGRGLDAVIVISERDYERLAGKRPNFKDFLMDGPGFDGVDLTRDKSPFPDVCSWKLDSTHGSFHQL